MRHPLLLATLTSLGVLTLSASALAIGGDAWPTLAHDQYRTARSAGKGAITQPQTAWKFDAGGSLNDDQFALADVDSDTLTDLIFVSGGRVVAKNAKGQPIWQSAIFGAQRVLGVYDLDKIPPAEVVVTGDSPAGVYILNSADGSRIWTRATPNSAFDMLAVPVSGGGHRLMLALQQGDLISYDFGAGIKDPPLNQSWSVGGTPWSVDMLTADIDGDKKPELIRGADRGFVAYDATTGAVKCNASAVISGTNTPSYFPVLSAADVNGDGRSEIILYDYSYFYSEDAGIFVVSCTGSPLTPQTLWSQQWINDTDNTVGTEVDAKEIRYLAEAVDNYDNKPGLEMVYSLWDASASTWTTYLVDAQTGTQLASKTGEVLEAAADLDDDGMLEVVLREATGLGELPKPYFSTLRLYNLNVGNFTNKGWTLPAGRVATLPARRDRNVTAGCGTVSAHQNVDVDPAQEFYVLAGAPVQSVDDPRPGKLLTVRAADGVVLDQYAFPDRVSGSMLGFGTSLQQIGSKMESVVMLNDGGLRLLDAKLLEFGKLTPGNWARLPSIVSLDGTHNVVIAARSNGDMVALDGTQIASQSPTQLWSHRDSIQHETLGYLNAPGMVLPAKAGPGASLVIRAHKTGVFEEQSLVALDASGNQAWAADLGTGRSVPGFENFELLDDLDGDGTREFFLTEIDATGAQELVIRKGSDGTTLVKRATNDLFPNADYLQGHAAVDLNGDGKLDIVSALHPQWFVGIDVSAAGGAVPQTAFVQLFKKTSSPNGQAVVAQLDADAMLDLLRTNSQNAFGPYERRDLFGFIEITTTSPHPNAVLTDTNTVAIISRPGQPTFQDFVWAGMAGDAMGAVAHHDGESFTQVWFDYLVGGSVLPKNPIPDGRAALFAPIAADVDGDGGDELLVGSSDGWLYALHTSDGALLFAKDMGAPVRHVVAADIDFDPEIELIVSLADGTVVGLDHPGKYTLSGGADPMPEAGPDAPPDGSAGAGGSAGSEGGVGGSAGSAGTSGQAGAAGAAGTAADAGDDAAAGAAPSPGGGGDEGGCGCRITGASPSHASAALLMTLAAVAFRRRFRRG